jgi:hypothetical protein
MAAVMSMRWEGVTPEQYNATRELVRWEEQAPEGGIFHVSWFEGRALRVIDVWESPGQFQRFADKRLMPGVQQIGIAGEPDVEFHHAHRYFNPQAGDRTG